MLLSGQDTRHALNPKIASAARSYEDRERQKIRRNTQKYAETPKQYAEMPKQKHPKQYAEMPKQKHSLLQ